MSWLPPTHPKSQISQPASQLREELHLKAADQDDDNVSSEESGSEQEYMEVSIENIVTIFILSQKSIIRLMKLKQKKNAK